MSTEPEPKLDFEAALRGLETIVDELERGAPGLSESLAKYERGVQLLARCHAELDRAERSVALLTGVDEAGNPLSTPLDPAATSEAITPTPQRLPRQNPARSLLLPPRRRATTPLSRSKGQTIR